MLNRTKTFGIPRPYNNPRPHNNPCGKVCTFLHPTGQHPTGQFRTVTIFHSNIFPLRQNLTRTFSHSTLSHPDIFSPGTRASLLPY